ncbi:hypothetical protein BJ970_000460 [Saccharopolyspora phatthalungensis]|uniref:Uncharacterized protein n=1 Tax=Saccharopolyspora phatthalungensis TaxID=664693 RepID=A0A840PX88_9PSEU|nr:hypothetical protein [Saccharopolyspora phatthalungensis]
MLGAIDGFLWVQSIQIVTQKNSWAQISTARSRWSFFRARGSSNCQKLRSTPAYSGTLGMIFQRGRISRTRGKS